MKRFGIRATALALAVLVGLSPAASASIALGDELHGGTVSLAPGTDLVEQVFWSNSKSDLRTERYISYSPADGVYPVVVYGDKLLSRQDLSAMAKSLEAQGLRVLGGVNGDFFDLSTGNALGVIISDGVLRTTSGGYYAVGFRADGTAFIGKPDLAVTATFNGATMRVTDVNKTRTAADSTHEGGLYLYTDEYSATTQHTSPGYDVILTPVTANVGQTVDVDLDVTDPEEASQTGGDKAAGDPGASQGTSSSDGSGDGTSVAADSQSLETAAPAEGTREVDEVTGSLVLTDQLTVGGRLVCTVDQVLESDKSIQIPQGKLVLTVNKQNNQWLLDQVSALKPGDQVSIDVTAADTRWNDVVTAIGGYYKIVTNGQVGPQTDSTANPRTAIGIKADGSVLFYAIDGRQSGYSIGATLTQVAQRLIELGCVEAVALDGGGSTTMGATLPDASAMSILGSPSDGSLRAVSNGIFLVSELEPNGVLDHYYVTPYDSVVLSGAQVALKATPVDENGYAFSDSAIVSWSIRNGDGVVDVDGVFTAGSESGTTQVTASSGRAEGSASVTVVKTPDSISVSNQTTGAPVTALALDPQESVDLTASAVWKKITLTSQDTCYTWSVDPAVGTVDENGVFTAGEKSATGNLTVSAGGAYVTIPVTIAGHIQTLDTFETDEGLAALTGSANALVNPETSGDLVRYGKQSVRVDYSAGETGSASLTANLAIPASDHYLSMWVYGDGSGNTLTATVADASGTATDVVLSALDFTGWKHLTAALPTGTTALRGLTVVYGGGEKAIGTLYLDQFTTSTEDLTDETVPTVTVSVENGKLTAFVSDNVDKEFEKSSVTLTLDGKAVDFTWSVSDGKLTYTLPAGDGKLHRLTVTAVDQSGNVGRGSYNILPVTQEETPEEGEGESGGTVTASQSPFVDMTAHWADLYTTYLYDMGVVQGVESTAGLLFQPDKNITRGEFALMVARWMGLDLASYADVTLPFADLDSTPAWCVDAMKAMYAEGILKGSLDNGVLMGRATASISRAEAMTILGRIQGKGYVSQALTDFTDAASVPAWSLSYVESLVGQGIISGYNGLLRPNDPVTRAEVCKMLFYLL